jgi:ribosome-associated protein
MEDLRFRKFDNEWIFTASRSSGPGGQHVNKVSTKIELRFNVVQTLLLSEEEKRLVLTRLAGRINKEGDLIIVVQTERSQTDNKEKAVERFYTLIQKALKVQKPRKKTKPTASSLAKRKKSKQVQAKLKGLRKKINDLE